MNNENEIRRRYATDQQWAKTSLSWRALKPKINFDTIDETDESISEYCNRVLKVVHLPYEVAEQWLYRLYFNPHNILNYGWIEYENIDFVLSKFSTKALKNTRVINEFTRYVEEIANCLPFDDFMCLQRDKQHWINAGTWRVPPIIVDVESFNIIPEHADFSGKLQLVEGHTRFGYFLSLYRSGKKLAANHKVYLLRKHKMHNARLERL